MVSPDIILHDCTPAIETSDIAPLTEYPPVKAHQGYRISLVPEPRTIRAVFKGQAVALSNLVLVMHETRLASTFYFPREDVRMDLLVESNRHTHCPFKGNASYWAIQVGNATAENAAWSYESPYDESALVKEYIAFDWNTIDEWFADDSRITKQPSNKSHERENPLAKWLVQKAWDSNLSRELVVLLSDAMIAAGFPLWRLRLLVRTLNPLLFAMGYTWQSNENDVSVNEVSHEVLQSEKYRNSPFAMILKGEGGIRRRLEGPDAQLDYPVLKDLVEEGATDYVAMPLRFSDGQLNILTLVSDQPKGFSTDQLGQVYEILPTLSRLFESHAVRLSSSTLLRTYLGADAGQRVMDGLVKRGDGDDIHAAIWMTDLRDSTSLAAAHSREDYLSLLNLYFESVAGTVLEHGGEVLKFIGDSVLAVFSIDNSEEEHPSACARALAAAQDASLKIEEVNRKHAADGTALINFGIGLHRGDLTYGNVGTTKRLDFTVIGSAVNEAARIESLTKILNQRILVSAAFSKSVSAPLVSLGHHRLRGVVDEHEIFALAEN